MTPETKLRHLQMLREYEWNQDPDDLKFEATGICLNCPKWDPHKDELGEEWGHCRNNKSESFDMVRNEQDGCQHYAGNLPAHSVRPNPLSQSK